MQNHPISNEVQEKLGDKLQVIKKQNLDPEKKERLLRLLSFCEEYTKKGLWNIEKVVCDPSWPTAYVEVISEKQLEINQTSLRYFKSALNLCDCLNVSTTPLGEDWVQMTFIIKDIWK